MHLRSIKQMIWFEETTINSAFNCKNFMNIRWEIISREFIEKLWLCKIYANIEKCTVYMII
jgi:hypothetical protein